MKYSKNSLIVIVAFVMVLLLLLASGVSGLRQLAASHQHETQLRTQYDQKRSLVYEMLAASRERAITLNLMLNLEDPFERDEQFMRYNALGARFASAREQLMALPLQTEELTLLGQQGEVVATGLESQHRVIELINNGQLEQARRLLTSAAIPTQLKVFSTLQELLEVQRVLFLKASELAAEGSQQKQFTAIVLLGLVSTAIGLLAVSLVVRHIQTTEHQLLDANERLDLALRGANDGLWDWNLRTGEVYYSPRWYEMLGYEAGDLEPSLATWERLVHPDDRAHAEADIEAHIQGRTEFYENTQRMRHKDGSYRWHLERGRAVRDKQGKPFRLVGTNTDITARKEAEDALFEAKERALVTLHSIGDAVITTDQFGRITYLNPIAEQLTGWSSEEASGRSCESICRLQKGEDSSALDSPAKMALERGTVTEMCCDPVLLDRLQRPHAITASAAPIRDRGGELIGTVMVLRDVTESREMATRLRWQASHDSLTGLVNRRELERRLQQMIDNARSNDEHHAFLYLDLDQFKLVNDTSGHLAGDELLRQLGFLLKGQLRGTDVLARLGGDEFGVLLTGCSLQRAETIAEKLRETINSFRFVWQERTFDVGVSIGVVPIDAMTTDIRDAMSAADVACYVAKERGRNRYHVHDHNDDDLKRHQGEMEWSAWVRDALDHDRFVLYQQAIVPIQTDMETGHYEILIRMQDEEGKIIPPGQFIPAAERYDLMPRVDRWVIEHTFEHMVKSPNEMHVSINLSGGSFNESGLPEFILERLGFYGLDAGRVCFEITETATITHLSDAARFISTMKQHGFRFSLDDFGSGLSSFTYLKQLPVDYLKIDGSFIRDLMRDPYDRVMVESICRVAQVMGLKTIAEFVENEAVCRELRHIGVDYAQGYGIARPQPLDGSVSADTSQQVIAFPANRQ